jgi:hypothetical protein
MNNGEGTSIELEHFDNLITDKIVCTNSITEEMLDILNREIRTVLYIFELHFKNNTDEFKVVRKAFLDAFNNYNRNVINRILNPVFKTANESTESLRNRVSELEKELEMIRTGGKRAKK